MAGRHVATSADQAAHTLPARVPSQRTTGVIMVNDQLGAHDAASGLNHRQQVGAANLAAGIREQLLGANVGNMMKRQRPDNARNRLQAGRADERPNLPGRWSAFRRGDFATPRAGQRLSLFWLRWNGSPVVLVSLNLACPRTIFGPRSRCAQKELDAAPAAGALAVPAPVHPAVRVESTGAARSGRAVTSRALRSAGRRRCGREFEAER